MEGIKIYEYLWGDKIPVETTKTWSAQHSKCSETSLSFVLNGVNYKRIKNTDSESVCLGLKEIFNIKSDSFNKKFEEACSGSGNELRKITTLHSSSLCALLFFYNVSEKKPLCFAEIPNAVFTDVYFEFKTPVVDSNRPSNMDVVLLGKEKGKNICLFLESKFSEYLSNNKTKISDKYLDKNLPIWYDKNLLDELQLKKSNCSEDGFFYIDGYPKYYTHGIKQMISHFIGVHNYLTNIPSKEKNQKLEGRELGNPSKVYLGEILFDFGDLSKPHIQSYSEKYKKLAEILNKKIENKYSCEFKVLKKVLSYNELKDYKKDESKIYNYYFGKNSK